MAELKCTYDPLIELMSYYANAKAQAKRDDGESLSLEDKLKRRIVDGDRIGIDDDLKRALEKYSPLQIINEILLDGMRTVGDLFGSGQMQLPFVLQSAETMKTAVNFLEPFMERVEGMQKGTMVLATVKGDVHDIGKNLVDIILTNNGYKVINLGIKVPIEQIIEAAEANKADAVGMSGLLVKSTVVMKENLEQMRQRGIRIPVVLGGAALTRRYVEQDLRKIYDGYLSYANDAFDGLHFMEEIKSGKIDVAELKDVETSSTSLNKSLELNNKATAADKGRGAEHGPEIRNLIPTGVLQSGRNSRVKKDVPVPTPPFYGSAVVNSMKLEKIWEYLNEVALIRGQWQFSKKGKKEEEYNKLLESEVYPALDEQKLIAKREKLFEPKVVYGYFPCQSSGEDLVIYRPKDEKDLFTKWKFKQGNTRDLVEWVRFKFPRQSDDRFLCISDYFRSVDSGTFDVIAMQVVTIGAKASEYTKHLFEDGSYQNYLYLHGLSVESAEALAEYWHKIIRTELGIHSNDATEMKRLFAQGYQGSRYSFGYPACPNLEDQAKLFELLHPERIGVTLTEEFQLVPEQSTTAIIVHHPEARYFIVK
ncbi:MAG TPA: vitamin B12 dependent-methionine synthase activation domain-containing protein [Candidatus Acidoferrales bacterium]|nr:vitamin B12 dependent-methionine synthase activation domain-containing protein [Candidatus Acidoferrales bacterium]